MIKNEIIRKLTAITNEITCMSEEELEENLINEIFEITFSNHCWGESAKIDTKIIMKKIKLDK